MSWSLILLNLQYCNHSLLSYNHSQIVHSLPQEDNSGVTFLEQSFSLYQKKSLRCFIPQYSTYTLLQNDNFIRIIFADNFHAGAVLTCKRHLDSNCEEGCQTKVFLLRRNGNTDPLVLIKLKFLRILNSSVNPRTSDEKIKL